jgi:hypothetical protein
VFTAMIAPLAKAMSWKSQRPVKWIARHLYGVIGSGA